MQLRLVVLLLVVASLTVWAKPDGSTKRSTIKQLLKAIHRRPEPKLLAQNVASNGTNVALVVQSSKDLISALIQMKEIAPNVVASLKDINEWVNRYAFWQFDDKNVEFIDEASDPEDLTIEITDFIDQRRDGEWLCKDLLIVDALIEALSNLDADQGIEVFLYVYGSTVVNQAKLRILNSLIGTTNAKIHVVQHYASIICTDAEDFSFTTIGDIAQSTGGIYSLSGNGLTLHNLPLQYKTKTVYKKQIDACQNTQQNTFTVDAGTWTLSLQLYGEIQGNPTLSGPNGEAAELSLLYGGSVEQAYLATAVNATSSADKLTPGQWAFSFDVYDFDDPSPCGLRVDVQTDA